MNQHYWIYSYYWMHIKAGNTYFELSGQISILFHICILFLKLICSKVNKEIEEVQFHDTKIDETPQKLHQIKKFRNE